MILLTRHYFRILTHRHHQHHRHYPIRLPGSRVKTCHTPRPPRNRKRLRVPFPAASSAQRPPFLSRLSMAWGWTPRVHFHLNTKPETPRRRPGHDPLTRHSPNLQHKVWVPQLPGSSGLSLLPPSSPLIIFMPVSPREGRQVYRELSFIFLIPGH